MQLSLQDLVTELTADISETLIALREYAEPRSLRIVAPCISSLEDGKRRLEGLEKRVATITESQLRAELIMTVRHLLASFDQLKRTKQVDLSWYEGELGSGIPPAVSKARELLGL